MARVAGTVWVGSGMRERERRHSGELYDAIWALEAPRISAGGKRAEIAVSRPLVRVVLMAMAKHTNPTRDRGQFRCWAPVPLIAALADVSERTVQRVLAVFLALGYIELEREGLRAGRGRPSRSAIWRLRPEKWPLRDMGDQAYSLRLIDAKNSTNGDDIYDATIRERAMVTTEEQLAATHASSPSNGRDCGDATVAMVATDTSPKPVIKRTRNDEVEPVNEPAPAAASAGNPTEYAHQIALPRAAAVPLPSRWDCPDCAQQVDEAGRGHRGGPNCCRNYGRRGQVTRCDGCAEWGDSSGAGHLTRCPTRQLEPTVDPYSRIDNAIQPDATRMQIEADPATTIASRNQSAGRGARRWRREPEEVAV